MLVSCICVCHNKPDVTSEAIQSILNQSYPNWEAIVLDSGLLYDSGYYDRFAWRHDPRVQLIRSEETDEICRTKAMAPWCFNECFRKGLVSGDLVMYLCDDDLLYANAFATFVSYCRQHPHAQAMYASQDIAVIYPNGWRAIVGDRRATALGGRCCNGRRMDCHVDYLQFCHKTEVLRILASDAYWPEGKESESHADGIFMERIGEHVPIYPIDVKVSQNRRTPRSTYVPVRSFHLVECLANGAPFLASGTGDSQPVHTGSDLRDGARAVVPGERAAGAAAFPEGGPLVTLSIIFRNPGTPLADMLAGVAAQTYRNLEVLVIDNSAAKAESASIFETLKVRYPQFRFLSQTCADNGARRDRGLWEARGDFFIPLDTGMLSCPDMVERFVAGMQRNSAASALACYVLAIQEARASAPETAAPPPRTEGPCLLASSKNLSSSGIFHTATFRKVGGYANDLSFNESEEMSGQDWLGFLKLVNAGYQVDVLPEHLFYYRPTSDAELSRMPILRPFFQADRLLSAERVALWTAFADMQQRLEQLAAQNKVLQGQNDLLQVRCGVLRYQIADRLITLCNRVPLARRGIQWLRNSIGLRLRQQKACLKIPNPTRAACPR